MKKKILITMTSMHIGGAERSLIGLLDALDYIKYDIDLFLYSKEGEFLKYITSNVNILDEIEEYKFIDKPINKLLFSKNYKFAIRRIIGKIKLKLYCLFERKQESTWLAMQYTTETLLPLLPKVKGEYDLAIGFIGIHSILINKINAKIKIGWIHTDYKELYPNKKKDIQVYDQLDYIVNVSDECTNSFLKIYPQYNNKALTIENILSKKIIEEQSKEKVFDFGKSKFSINFLSLGRFSYAKNFDNIPEICKYIIDSGVKIKWFIIGYGGDEKKIKEKIKKYKMQENVFILGKKSNPYPYIKLCDFYVQPSRYEGKAVAVREAQILNKPVIITNFSTSKSQLKNGIDGVVVQMDSAQCAKDIIDFIKNKNLIKKIIENTKISDYTNQNEVKKIYKILGGEL